MGNKHSNLAQRGDGGSSEVSLASFQLCATPSRCTGICASVVQWDGEGRTLVALTATPAATTDDLIRSVRHITGSASPGFVNVFLQYTATHDLTRFSGGGGDRADGTGATIAYKIAQDIEGDAPAAGRVGNVRLLGACLATKAITAMHGALAPTMSLDVKSTVPCRGATPVLRLLNEAVADHVDAVCTALGTIFSSPTLVSEHTLDLLGTLYDALMMERLSITSRVRSLVDAQVSGVFVWDALPSIVVSAIMQLHAFATEVNAAVTLCYNRPIDAGHGTPLQLLVMDRAHTQAILGWFVRFAAPTAHASTTTCDSALRTTRVLTRHKRFIQRLQNVRRRWQSDDTGLASVAVPGLSTHSHVVSRRNTPAVCDQLNSMVQISISACKVAVFRDPSSDVHESLLHRICALAVP